MTCGFMISVVVHILALFVLFPSTESAARFTQVPPSKLYVVKGGTARFVWDYHVDDRDKEFRDTSPKWLVDEQPGVGGTIGFDLRAFNWTFVIDRTCPSRLLSPTVRVSKESNATLVITNVTIADSGLYKCVLILSSGIVASMPLSKVQLVVTDSAARFTKVPPSKLYVVKGGTARLVWDYHVDDKMKDFRVISPDWYFRYNKSSNCQFIGADNGYIGWKFYIYKNDCPPRLLSPTVRVKKEPKATLVITNVTMDDSGLYGCFLRLRFKQDIATTVQLIVTGIETHKDMIKYIVLSGRVCHQRTQVSGKKYWRRFSLSVELYSWDTRSCIGVKLCSNLFKNYIYTDIYSYPDAAVYATYKGRVSFVGNLTAGHAWFKIINLTISDTSYYGVEIREKTNIHSFTKYWVQLKVIDLMPHFIQVPPRILYVAIGQAAKFVWDYVAGNKTADFDLQSPRWEVYNSVNGWKTIGADHSTSGWQWKLNASCPARLQTPTRVSKASTASLVIYNVTTEDSGIYRCNLTLRDRPPVTSTSQLVVTVGPHFVSPLPSSKNITEGQHLKILCSATGPPTPNVTWVRVQGVSKVTVSNGVGNALLSISNITKEQTGRNRRYECQAANNPNQGHVTTQTRIYVMYKPSIDHSKSDATVTSLPVAIITLRCMFSGFPCPNATWYKPDEEPIKENVTSFCGLSEILLYIKDAQDYGKYKCRVENILGYSEHNITVIAYDLETNVNHNQQSRVTIAYGRDPVFIVCITIIVVFFIIIVIMVFLIIKLRREASKTKKTSHFGIINMSEKPVPSPTRISTHETSSSNQAVDDYAQPDVETITSSSSHVGTNYPYDIPDILFVDGTSTSTSQPSHYQELNTNNTTSRDYQSLQDARTAAVNPSSIQPEISNPYEPLRLKKESQYQQLNRH